MISSRVLQLLFLVSSMTPQVIGMLPVQKKGIVEGIAQKIEELPKELKYKIFSSVLALRENLKYEIYKKFPIGSSIQAIALNADNTRALTIPMDGLACIWDVEKGELLKVLRGHTIGITSMALSAEGNLALTGSRYETARVWDMNTGELLKTLEVGSYVYAVALSANGALALTGGLDKTVRLYNTSTGELLKELKGHTQAVKSVALSADGTLALTGSYDETARVWNMNTGEFINNLEVGFSVCAVALSAEGTLALIRGDKKVMVWNVKTGAVLNTLLTGVTVRSVALSKDEGRVLVGTVDNTIQVWNTKSLPGQKETSTFLTVLAGHTGQVTAVAFGSADFIASGSMDNTALIWKLFALEQHYWPLKEGVVDWEAFTDQEKASWKAYREIFSRPKSLFPDEKQTS